jgi:hypothetical protein
MTSALPGLDHLPSLTVTLADKTPRRASRDSLPAFWSGLPGSTSLERLRAVTPAASHPPGRPSSQTERYRRGSCEEDAWSLPVCGTRADKLLSDFFSRAHFLSSRRKPGPRKSSNSNPSLVPGFRRDDMGRGCVWWIGCGLVQRFRPSPPIAARWPAPGVCNANAFPPQPLPEGEGMSVVLAAKFQPLSRVRERGGC